MGAFEVVTDDGALLYSKLDTGFPPDIAEVTEIVVQYLKRTKKPSEQGTINQDHNVSQQGTSLIRSRNGLLVASTLLIAIIGVVLIRTNRTQSASSKP